MTFARSIGYEPYLHTMALALGARAHDVRNAAADDDVVEPDDDIDDLDDDEEDDEDDEDEEEEEEDGAEQPERGRVHGFGERPARSGGHIGLARLGGDCVALADTEEGRRHDQEPAADR